ncbi:hypothetical protein, partial [Leptospira weilii]|uniref:hypothetical protein n=1 Tax=Leptospira weilii TaxID=28184 RepID=UPI0002BDB1FC
MDSTSVILVFARLTVILVFARLRPVLLSLTASPNTYICLSLFSISSPSWETHSLGSDSSRHS